MNREKPEEFRDRLSFTVGSSTGGLELSSWSLSGREASGWDAVSYTHLLALIMLFVGGLATYTFVWDLGDVGIGLMTIFNILVILPMSKEALASLREYEQGMKERKRTQ